MNNVNNEIHWSDNGRDNLQCWPQGTRQPQYCTTSRQWRLLFCDRVTMVDNAWTFVQKTIETSTSSWTKQCLWSDFAVQFLTTDFNNVFLYFQSVWKTMLFFNNLRDGVKIQVYIQYSDTSGVQHMYTMHPAGPLGQVTETIAQRVKVLSDNTITACTSWVDFYISIYLDLSI